MSSIQLRSILDSDASELARLANNTKIADNLRLLPHPYTLKDAQEFISKVKGTKNRRTISLKGDYIGMIGLHPRDGEYSHSGEMGYWIGEEYWGKGYATQAVNKMCLYGFAELGLKRIFASVIEYNPASARVLQKCGFHEEGIAKKAIYKLGKHWDEIRFARLSPDLSSS